MATFDDLVRAAAALRQAGEPAEPKKKLFEGIDIPAEPPLLAREEFFRSLGAGAVGGLLGFAPGLADLLTFKQVPALEALTKKAHEFPKRLFGVPEEPEHPITTMVGDLVGQIIATVPAAFSAGLKAAHLASKVPAIGKLAVTSPLLARSLQVAAESVAAEATTAEPSWKGVIGFGLIDMGLRSRPVSMFLDKTFPRIRSPKVNVWDFQRGHWMRVRDLRQLSGDVGFTYKAIETLATDLGKTPGAVVDALTRAPRQIAWHRLHDPAFVTISDTAKNIMLTTTNGKVFTLTGPDAFVDATRVLLSGDDILRVSGPREMIDDLKKELLWQPTDEVELLFRAALRQRPITAGARSDKEAEKLLRDGYKMQYIDHPELVDAIDGARPLNYAVVRDATKGADGPLRLVSLTKKGLEKAQDALLRGEASIVDFVLLDPKSSVLSHRNEEISRVLAAAFPKPDPGFPWEAPGVVTKSARFDGRSTVRVEFSRQIEKDAPLEVGDFVTAADAPGLYRIDSIDTQTGLAALSQQLPDGATMVVKHDVHVDTLTRQPGQFVPLDAVFELEPSGALPTGVYDLFKRYSDSRITEVKLKEIGDIRTRYKVHQAIRALQYKGTKEEVFQFSTLSKVSRPQDEAQELAEQSRIQESPESQVVTGPLSNVLGHLEPRVYWKGRPIRIQMNMLDSALFVYAHAADANKAQARIAFDALKRLGRVHPSAIKQLGSALDDVVTKALQRAGDEVTDVRISSPASLIESGPALYKPTVELYDRAGTRVEMLDGPPVDTRPDRFEVVTGRALAAARYPTNLTKEMHRALQAALQSPGRSNKSFVDHILPEFDKVFGINEVAVSDTARGLFLQKLQEGLKSDFISPNTYASVALLVRNLPEDLFQATNLSLQWEPSFVGGAMAELITDVSNNITKIVVAPGASVDVFAHELAEQALKLLKPKQAKELASRLAEDFADVLETQVPRLAGETKALGGDNVDVVAGMLAEYMINKYVHRVYPAEVVKRLESGTAWGWFKNLTTALWETVKSLRISRNAKIEGVYEIFDKILSPGPVQLQETVTRSEFSKMLENLDIYASTTGTLSRWGGAFANDLRAHIKFKKNAPDMKVHRGSLRFSRSTSGLTSAEVASISEIAVRKVKEGLDISDLTHTAVDAKVDETYNNLVKLYGHESLPHKDAITQASEYFVIAGDHRLPLGLVSYVVQHNDKQQIWFYMTDQLLDYVRAYARPLAPDMDNDAWVKFIRAANSTLLRKWREETFGAQKKYLQGIRQRLSYGVGLSPFEMYRLKLRPSSDKRFAAVLDGPPELLQKIDRRLAKIGWTMEDLIHGFRIKDGSNELNVSRYVIALLGNEPRLVGDVSEPLVIRIDQKPVLKETAKVRRDSGSVEEYSMDNLWKVPYKSKTAGKVTGIETQDPDTALALIDRTTLGNTAPFTIISDEAVQDNDFVVWYLRRPGHPLDSILDEVIVTPSGFIDKVPKPGEEMALHKFRSRELQLALASGYRIQALYGNFKGVDIKDLTRDIQRGLANMPKMDTSAMVFDPAGLKYLIDMADSRGFHLLPNISEGQFKLISHTSGDSFSLKSGDEIVNFLLTRPRVDTGQLEPTLEGELLQLARRIRMEIPQKEVHPNLSEIGVYRGFMENALKAGKSAGKLTMAWFDSSIAPTRDAVPFVDRLTKGKYKLTDLYHEVRETVNKHITITHDSYTEMVGDLFEGMTGDELRQINLALAYYVGAPKSILDEDVMASALRAEFLQKNKLSERQMAAIRHISKKFTDEYARISKVMEDQGHEPPMHIFGYTRRQIEGGTDPYIDLYKDLEFGDSPVIPGQLKERAIQGIIEAKHVLPADVMLMRYLFANRYYEYVRPVLKKVDNTIKAVQKQGLRNMEETATVMWLRHLANQLMARNGAPPNTLIAAVTDVMQKSLGDDATADKVLGDLITYVYGTSLGGRLSAAVRNRTHPFLLLFPFAGAHHTRRGISMAREYLKDPSGELSKYIDTTFATWTPEAIDKAKKVHTLLRNRGDSLAVKYAETMLILMQKTETRNKSESFFTGVSIAEEVLNRLRKGEAVKSVVESTPLQAMDPATRSYILKHADLALNDASHVNSFYKRMGELVVAHTAWLYGPLEMPGWTRTRFARLMLMYMTWSLNYMHYVLRGLKNVRNEQNEFTPYGKAFLRRFLLMHGAGAATFAALGINNDNMFFIGPAEYTGGPFFQLALDALDAARLSGDIQRPAVHRLQRQFVRTLMPAGAGIREILNILKSTSDVIEGKAPIAEPLYWMFGTPERVIESRRKQN